MVFSVSNPRNGQQGIVRTVATGAIAPGDFDNFNEIEKYTIHLIKRSVSSKEISQKVYNDVKPIGSIRPIMYGLPKLHKSQVLLRPILLITKSPKHKLVRFLNLLLQLFDMVERIRIIKSDNTFLNENNFD